MFQIKWIWENLKGHRKGYILALVLTVITQIMYLINPIFSKTIVNNFIYGDNALQNLTDKRQLLITLCVCMVAFTILRASLQFSANMLYEKTSQGMIMKIKNFLFENVQKQDMSFFNKNSTGDLMTRMSGDLDMIRHAVAWIIKSLLESVVLFTSTTVYFFILDPIMALCMMILTPVIFLISNIFRRQIGPMYMELRECGSKLNSNAQENIAGNRVVRAFAREEYEIEKFQKTNKEFSEANKKAALTWIKFFPYIETAAQGLSVVQLIAGGIFVIIGRITMGDFVAFSALIWTLSNPMRMIGNLVNDLQRFMASASKVIEIYYSRPFIVDRVEAIDKSSRFMGEIEFKNVYFKFKNSIILDNISFKIQAGETVAIMGETGSGKTTLINLISRFYDPSGGEILVDGTNIRLLKLKQLRKNIGVAMQDVLLWSDTIDSNIAFGNSDMSDDDVKKFAALADADTFINKLEDGYDTIIGERGVGLSGGQKQRVSLARALAVRPSILILDDTTSAVDLETEHKIQKNLNSLDFCCTKIIIAQRISSAKNADKIIILKDGKISEMGSHEELLSIPDGYYREIYNLQHESIDEEVVSNG